MAITQKRLSLALSKRDKEHLERLMKALGETQSGVFKLALHNLYFEVIKEEKAAS